MSTFQPTSQRQNLDFYLRYLGFFFFNVSLFNLFSYLVLMHNLLDDVECTVEKECSFSDFRSRDLFIWPKTEGGLFSRWS